MHILWLTTALIVYFVEYHIFAPLKKIVNKMFKKPQKIRFPKKEVVNVPFKAIEKG